MLDGHMWKLAGLVPSRPMMKHMRDCLIIRQISLVWARRGHRDRKATSS